MRVWLLILALALLPFKVAAEGRAVALYAPPALVDTGLLDYALPRFTLKTQVRVTRVDDPGAAQVLLGSEGRPLFEGAGQLWSMRVVEETEWTARFADWLGGEIGQATVLSYAPQGAPLFALPQIAEPAPEAPVLAGDPALGLRVARQKCTRCHRVEPGSAMIGIGSTPSFSVLRSLPDWQARFAGFYALNPHPAFTQIDEVTPPFDKARPSPIVPIEMTLDEVDAVTAYVAAIAAADLGAPLAHQ
jgi:mono/diheme cytochrome c family protein